MLTYHRCDSTPYGNTLRIVAFDHAAQGRGHLHDEAAADTLRRQNQTRRSVPTSRSARGRGDGETHRGGGRALQHRWLARGGGLPALPLLDLGEGARHAVLDRS